MKTNYMKVHLPLSAAWKRLLFILSQTFYYEQKSNSNTLNKIYLQQGIAKHKYFQNRTFWEQVLNKTSTDDGNQIVTEDETLEEKKFREENEIFVRLGTYAHNMLQFGLKKELVEDIVFKVADKFQLPKPYIEAVHLAGLLCSSLIMSRWCGACKVIWIGSIWSL